MLITVLLGMDLNRTKKLLRMITAIKVKWTQGCISIALYYMYENVRGNLNK